MEFETTNKSEFKEKGFDRVQQVRPKTTNKLEGEFESTTTNQAMFQQHGRPEKTKQIRHPGNLKQEGSMEFETTNKSEFKEKSFDRVQQVRPKATSKIEGKFDSTTTNQDMFQQRGTPEKTKQIRHPGNLKQEGSMDFETTNKSEFKEKSFDRVQQVRPKATSKIEGKFESTTTNQDMFQQRGTPEKTKQIRQKNNLKQEGSMEFETTNKSEFKEKSFDRVKQVRPKTTNKMEGKFESTTTNQAMFQQHGMPEKTKQIRHKSNLKQEGSMEFETTNKSEFKEKSFDRVQQVRPKTTNKLEGEFESTTTNQAMFQQHGTPEKTQQIRHQGNLKQEGNMQFETTNKSEFKEKSFDRVQQVRPKETDKIEGKFDATTTNQVMFQQHGTPEKTIQIRHQGNLKQEGSMEFETTNKSEFKEKSFDRVQQVRPKATDKIEGKFDATTTNQVMFQQHGTPEKTIQIRHQGNLKQEGSMEFETTNKSEFKEKSFDRVQQVRPKETDKIEGKFDATTTNQVMFQQHGTPEKSKPIRQLNNLQLEKGKFSKETTNSREYRQWVKMESKESPSKKAPIAAGVRSNKDDISPSKIDDTKPGNAASQYESWKLKGESKEIQIGTENVDRISPELKRVSGSQKEAHKDQNGTFTSQHQNRQENISRTNDFTQILKTTTLKQELNGSANEVATQVHSAKRAVGYQDGRQLDVKDVSTVMADYGAKQTSSKVKAVIPAGNLSSEGEMMFSTTSKSDYVQTNSVHNQQTNRVVGEVKISPNKALMPIGNLSNEGEMMFSTTSKSDYGQTNRLIGEGNISTSKAVIPTGNLSSEGNMVFSTTSKSDYGQTNLVTGVGKITPNKAVIPTGNLSSEGNMVFSTTSKSAYGKTNRLMDVEKISPSKAVIPTGNLSSEGNMVFSTTSKSDYGQTNLVTGEGKITPNKAVIPTGNLSSEGEMMFSTTSKSDYKQTNLGTTQQINRSASGVKMSSSKSSQLISDNGIISTTEERGKRSVNVNNSKSRDVKDAGIISSPSRVTVAKLTRAVKPADNLRIESIPFEGASTTQIEYSRPEGRRSSSKRRTESLKQEGKMEFNTTSNDYNTNKMYLLNRETTLAKSKSDQRGSLGQSGSMDFHTTSNSSYTGDVGSKSKALRPRSTIKLGTDQPTSYESSSRSRSNPETPNKEYQDLASTSHASYVGHATNRRSRSNRPTTSQKVGQGQFEGFTTSRSSFIAHQENLEKPSRAIRPENHNILNASKGFSGATTYNNSFESTKGHHCPVLDLQGSQSSFTFNEEKNGHMFYAAQTHA